MRYVALVCGLLLLPYLVGCKPRSGNPVDGVTPAEAPKPALKNSQAAALVQGVDLSKWQGVVNFQQIKSADKYYVFIKVTQGMSGVDQDYKTNIENARAAGLLVGSYHFYVTQDKAEAQFSNLSRHLSLQPGDLPPVVDIEVLSQSSQPDIKAELRQFLVMIEQHYRVRPIIYSGENFANQYLTGFENYPLWLAEYRQNETPQLPLNWKRWTFWQYSQNGRVAGINGSVDLNQFNGTAEQLRALLVK
jgi:lysozyme